MPSLEQHKLYANGLKQCSSCKRVLPFVAYNMRIQDGKEYCVTRCKECLHLTYRKNREKIREYHRRQNIGAPLGTYNFLIAEYGAQCSICKNKNPGGTSKNSGQFHIDHDHDTGIIRGLLCNNCNVGIGMLKHNSQLMLSAIHYLARPGYSIEDLEKITGNSGKLQNSINLSAEELGL